MSTLLKKIQDCATGPATRTSDGAREMTFIFPPSFTCFDGHFPDTPILPGMVQIMAAMLAAGEGTPQRLLKIGRAKFMRIVHPGEALHATAVITRKNGLIHAAVQLTVNGEPAATLPLVLEPANPAS